MRFLLRRIKAMDPEQRANGTALAIALATMTFLQLECQPRPAGADTVKLAVYKTNLITPKAIASEPQSTDQELTPEQIHEKMLAKKVALLEKGRAFLNATPDYTAQFCKRELVNGELLEEQTMLMKLRHAPFSVYLKWTDYEVGREVMFVDGVNEGKMLVKSGGWKSRLPSILMSPDSSMAMNEARYPVTRAGLLALADTILEYNRQDLQQKTYSSCQQLEDQIVGDRVCHCFVLEYKSRTISKDYRKSITMLDKEWCVPVFIKNFGWPNEDVVQNGEELDEATLIEHYTYTDIKFRSSLSSRDFDHVNEDYGFRRQ